MISTAPSTQSMVRIVRAYPPRSRPTPAHDLTAPHPTPVHIVSAEAGQSAVLCGGRWDDRPRRPLGVAPRPREVVGLALGWAAWHLVTRSPTCAASPFCWNGPTRPPTGSRRSDPPRR